MLPLRMLVTYDQTTPPAFETSTTRLLPESEINVSPFGKRLPKAAPLKRWSRRLYAAA